MNSLSYISVSIALVALTFTAWNILRDRAKLVVRYNILVSNDSSRTWLRLEVMNIGRRPILITGHGYKSWSSGWEILKGSVDPITIGLKEAELQAIDLDFPEREIWWDVKQLFVVDHNGKKWNVPIRLMSSLYEHSHGLKSLQSEAHVSKWIKKRNRQFDKAYAKYYRWAKRKDFIPKDRIFKNFEDSSSIANLSRDHSD